MRQLFLFISFLIFSFSCLLGHATTVTNGDRSYQEKDFTKALQYYREQVASTPSSSGYYNLGNTYYRLKEYGQSVLAYRRALHLDPGNADARHNLSLVETHLTNPISKTDNSVWEALLNDWIDVHSLAFLDVLHFHFSPRFILRSLHLEIFFPYICPKDGVFALLHRRPSCFPQRFLGISGAHALQ